MWASRVGYQRFRAVCGGRSISGRVRGGETCWLCFVEVPCFKYFLARSCFAGSGPDMAASNCPATSCRVMGSEGRVKSVLLELPATRSSPHGVRCTIAGHGERSIGLRRFHIVLRGSQIPNLRSQIVRSQISDLRTSLSVTHPRCVSAEDFPQHFQHATRSTEIDRSLTRQTQNSPTSDECCRQRSGPTSSRSVNRRRTRCCHDRCRGRNEIDGSLDSD